MEELQKMWKIWSINGKVTQKKIIDDDDNNNKTKTEQTNFCVKIHNSHTAFFSYFLSSSFMHNNFMNVESWIKFFFFHIENSKVVFIGCCLFAFNSIKFHHYKPMRLYLLFSVNSLLLLVSKEYWNFSLFHKND